MRGYHWAISYRLPSRPIRSAPCSGTLKAYRRSNTVVSPGASGRARSTHIIVSSTRWASEVGGSGRGGSVASADERRRGGAVAPDAAGELWVRLAISNPPWNPDPPNRLSAANRSEPVLPGLNRFWSTCIHTKRSVSGEWLV